METHIYSDITFIETMWTFILSINKRNMVKIKTLVSKVFKVLWKMKQQFGILSSKIAKIRVLMFMIQTIVFNISHHLSIYLVKISFARPAINHQLIMKIQQLTNKWKGSFVFIVYRFLWYHHSTKICIFRLGRS